MFKKDINKKDHIINRRWFLSKASINGMKLLAEQACGSNPRQDKSYEQCLVELAEFFHKNPTENESTKPNVELFQFILAVGLDWEPDDTVG